MQGDHFSLWRLRLQNLMLIVAAMLMLAVIFVPSPLVRMLLVLTGGGIIAWDLVYTLSTYHCPECGRYFKVSAGTLFYGEYTYCHRCGQGIEFR